ncbi:uncharacterized protein TRAVEDRAFT_72812 [Trametes versicolor FP-101664 SS1]|uniref:uncharacterized protein n=1 Tax=Trametes versicolor (strain FP-101664) TaxID=717944 RepID=UPI0004622DB4|nr:uncharacterized protein TRAVEDRAFT_72812 [Trametes versicolor FP-101664 SS1]EIW57861.1 hypothetical protein TRAVEDRAFT_72812 [Trametes versicolor FP-101664 SS1]
MPLILVRAPELVSAPEPAFPAIDNLYGAYLLGTFVSLMLFGVSVHQLYRYARTSKTDTFLIRSLVATVMALETLHTVFLMHTCYYYLVTNYADFTGEKITHSVWSMQVTPVITALITLISQVFFARRVSLLGFRYRVLVALASLALLAHVGFGLAITIDAIKLDSLSGFDRGGDWLFPLATGSSTVADLMLSSAIIISVRKSRAGNARPKVAEGPFDVAVLYVLNSGLLTGLVNLPPAIAGIFLPQTLIWAGLSFVGARLYAITLLSVLNSRKFSATRGMEIFDAASFGPNIIARANHIAAVERWNTPKVLDETPAKIDISVEAEVEVDHELGERHYGGRKSFDSEYA